jgi:hypothetical protein
MFSIDIQTKKSKESLNFKKNFEKLIYTFCPVKEIEKIHEFKTSKELFSKGTDQESWLHKQIYKDFDKCDKSKLIISYYQLCMKIKKDLSNSTGIKNWAIQRFPSVRIQYPENISVFEFHKDSDYNHPLGEINIFMAITKCEGTATLNIEKNLGWRNYEPLILDAGEFAKINTSIFKHGDYINKENYTRISVDFRMIPTHVLNLSEVKNSLSKNRKFTENDYFRNSRDIEKTLKNS